MSVTEISTLPALHESMWLIGQCAKRASLLPKCYPHACVTGHPIFLLPAQIDNPFLETCEGKILRSATQWLLKKDALKAKTELEFYTHLNKELAEGICRGTAVSYLLHTRTNEPQQKRITALFIQLMPHIRLELVKLDAKHIDSAVKLAEKLIWSAAKKHIVASESVEKIAAIMANVRAVFSKTPQPDLIINLGFEKLSSGHAIVIRPNALKAYDQEFGELSWKSSDELLYDLDHYLNVRKATNATIDTIMDRFL